jgi:chemotaxis protein methyltransferase CheR
VIQKTREFEFTFEDFDYLRKLSNQHSGILVPDDKFDMFYSRLSRRVRALGLANFKQYCQYLNDNKELEFTDFINAVTTNLTAFFRENHHFGFLHGKVIPDLIKKNQHSKTIKVWSAGCSTGEEPYSIAMTLMDSVPPGWTIKILATDLDTEVLATAASGVYSGERVDGLPEKQIKKCFQKGKEGQLQKVRVKSELRQLIYFKQLNLMGEWPMKGPFDFIFCRNVLIYFDKDTKEMLAKRYGELLASKSYLFIGHSESLHQLSTDFDLIGNTIYQKV